MWVGGKGPTSLSTIQPKPEQNMAFLREERESKYFPGSQACAAGPVSIRTAYLTRESGSGEQELPAGTRMEDQVASTLIEALSDVR